VKLPIGDCQLTIENKKKGFHSSILSFDGKLMRIIDTR